MLSLNSLSTINTACYVIFLFAIVPLSKTIMLILESTYKEKLIATKFR